MIKKILKWITFGLGAIVGLFLVALLGYSLYWVSKAEHTYDIAVETFEIPTDEASISRGEVLVEAVRCTECHGKDLSGEFWVNRPAIGMFGPSNLTAGENGIAGYTDEDYIRAIRHSVDRDGKPLIYMPSNFYRELNQTDLGAIIAYLKTLPASENPGPPNITYPYIWKLALSEPQGLPSVYMIDHEQTEVPNGPAVEDTLAYGEYLALSCKSCHADDLAGKARLERLGIMTPNITPYGIGDWTEEDFLRLLREGVKPDGKIAPEWSMPWVAIGKLPDEELHAMWLYLQSMPPVPEEEAIGFQNSE